MLVSIFIYLYAGMVIATILDENVEKLDWKHFTLVSLFWLPLAVVTTIVWAYQRVKEYL